MESKPPLGVEEAAELFSRATMRDCKCLPVATEVEPNAHEEWGEGHSQN